MGAAHGEGDADGDGDVDGDDLAAVNGHVMPLPLQALAEGGVLGFALFRGRYYFAWYLSEVSFVASGAGYAGSGKWDRVRNVYPLQVEFAENIRAITSNWNVCTANWLK